jgi:nucleotide-binding universal stress UspA family protein
LSYIGALEQRVAAALPKKELAMKEHLLVPLAGTPESESVLSQLPRLAKRGSTVTLLRTELPAALEQYTDLSDAALEHARRYLEELKGRLSGLKVPIRTLARIGAPAETILGVAREIGATLILLSSGRPSAVARFLFGSVPATVVKHSPVPVLVIPATVEEPVAAAHNS